MIRREATDVRRGRGRRRARMTNEQPSSRAGALTDGILREGPRGGRGGRRGTSFAVRCGHVDDAWEEIGGLFRRAGPEPLADGAAGVRSHAPSTTPPRWSNSSAARASYWLGRRGRPRDRRPLRKSRKSRAGDRAIREVGERDPVVALQRLPERVSLALPRHARRDPQGEDGQRRSERQAGFDQHRQAVHVLFDGAPVQRGRRSRSPGSPERSASNPSPTSGTSDELTHGISRSPDRLARCPPCPRRSHRGVRRTCPRRSRARAMRLSTAPRAGRSRRRTVGAGAIRWIRASVRTPCPGPG